MSEMLSAIEVVLNGSTKQHFLISHKMKLKASLQMILPKKESEVMKLNAFKVCDGATAPGGQLKAFVSKPLDEIFFADKHYLEEYISRR